MWRAYAMDTYFYSSIGSYPFETRCAMLADLGYDGTYHTLWDEQAWKDLKLLPLAKSKYGLEVAGVYATWDLAAGWADGPNAQILRMIESIQGCAIVELAMAWTASPHPRSDPAGDDAAMRALDAVLQAAARSGVRILLYPHISFWLERIDDGVRLCRKMAHARLGVTFCGFHWYAVDGTGLPGKLSVAGTHLKQVNLCGTRKPGPIGNATIEPLDSGELDHFALLGHLQSIGYEGWIGFQGFAIGGDVYSNLERSLRAYRQITERLERHQEWCKQLWK